MEKGEGKNWRGLEPEDDVLTTCKAINTNGNQRYFQVAKDLRCCSWYFEQIFEDRNCLLQMKCIMSASVEIIFYWAWLIISVWDKVNARTRNVIIHSHANGTTRLPWRYVHKNNWFWKACCSHCSYLANIVELCFYNRLDFSFFFFNALSSFVPQQSSFSCITHLTLLLVFVSFLIVRMVFVKYITYKT